jgi:hypothetical protein
LSDKRKREDSTSLFTLVAPNAYDVEELKLESNDGRKATFRAVLRNAVSQETENYKIDFERSGSRLLETENIPVFAMTMTPQSATHGTVYLMTTNQALIKAMRILRPEDDANQTNQRLRRKWLSQKFIRLRVQHAREIAAAFPEMAYMKFRAGLVLLEWPRDAATLSHLTADKQMRPRIFGSDAVVKRARSMTKEQLSRELEARRVRIEEVEADAARLRRLVALLAEGKPVPQEFVALLRASQQHAEADEAAAASSQPLGSMSSAAAAAAGAAAAAAPLPHVTEHGSMEARGRPAYGSRMLTGLQQQQQAPPPPPSQSRAPPSMRLAAPTGMPPLVLQTMGGQSMGRYGLGPMGGIGYLPPMQPMPPHEMMAGYGPTTWHDPHLAAAMMSPPLMRQGYYYVAGAPPAPPPIQSGSGSGPGQSAVQPPLPHMQYMRPGGHPHMGQGGAGGLPSPGPGPQADD